MFTSLSLKPVNILPSFCSKRDFADVIKAFEMGETALDYPGGPIVITGVLVRRGRRVRVREGGVLMEAEVG